MESCTSLQSLVESIDDDHVLRLTEMTKKRVEHNNPGQKRQRVVSLLAVEANFQPSEKTLQFSNSCKTYLESRYTQLYQSINAGRPINRLRKLHEIFPQIKSISTPKPEGKASLDLAHSRSRRWKNDKYRFVDKVEESSCIWDVDHMEAKAAAQAAVEAAVFAKQSIVASSRHGSQHHLEGVASPSPHSSTPHLPSASTESLGVMNVSSGGAIPPSSVFGHPLQCDSPLAVVDRFSPMHQKETLGESKLRFGEVHPLSLPTPSHSTLPIKSVDSGISSNGPESVSVTMEPPPSRRNSIFGIFSMRGKKGGQDGDPLYTHQEVPQPSSHDSLQPTAMTTQERRSFDSNPPPKPSVFNPGRRRLSVMELASWQLFSSAPANTNTMAANTQPFHRTSEEGARTGEYSDAGNAVLTDDEFGGHFAPPSQWPQGERTEESQDESDPATAASKRSSLRRFKDRMTWKRGTKTLSVIQQGEPFRTNFQSTGSGKQINIDGNKSLGKKVDPALASLRGVNSGRASMSEPSSGRNSMENPSRPKQSNFRILSGTSSPVLEAVKNPDGVGISSPRVGPSVVGADGRMDRSSAVNLSRNDKSSMANPSSTTERSPILNAIRTEKSPTLVAESMFVGDNPSGNVATTHPLQLLVDVDRIPKRLLQRLKARPELSSINWTADTVDLSALWTSPDPPPTYEEYVGISDAMKASKFYPSHLDDIDVLEIHLTLGVEESRDFKNRANRWDMLELRIDQELVREEKWLKEVSDWSRSKVNAIARHQQAEISKDGGARTLDESAPLVEEPEAEEDAGEAAADATVEEAGGDDAKNRLYATPRETFRARKLREMSLLSVRDLGGSMSSIHTSVTYTFKASVETTREAVKEMSGYLEECRQRLKQLNDATGERLQTQEPVFQEIVEQFSREWNETYFVMLKDVEDQIQVMNSKRIENPWMDVLLIILSWFIRGVFYMVEGVTIMIIIVRHAWGKAKKGFNAVRHPAIANEPGSPAISTDAKGQE
ncbi:hypothetical protein BGX34_010724 [Mortierella sp. NVP85]|nr:hypothetical protein BGX34_010724 [Mortierella sp. NVP85]